MQTTAQPGTRMPFEAALQASDVPIGMLNHQQRLPHPSRFRRHTAHAPRVTRVNEFSRVVCVCMQQRLHNALQYGQRHTCVHTIELEAPVAVE